MFWVDASSHESITMSLRGLSNIPPAQASGVDGSVESVLQWISCIPEEWLIVFDNADAPPPEEVAKYFPPGNRGNILITSRNRSMGRVISFENIIEINEMKELDAMTLLLRASCLDSLPVHLQVAKNIVTELGCIPLAVNHAGAYIEAGNCDINNYLRQLSLHRQALMSDATFKGASNYNQTVYGTWDLSFKEIERRASGQPTTGNAQAAQAAILILQICAFYHHSNISKEIFRSAAEESGKYVVNSEVAEKLPQAMNSLDHTLLALDSDGHWDEFIFGQGVSVLLSFSLMKRGQSSELLSVHPLVHCWSREQMIKSEQQRICQVGSIILSCAISWRYTSQDYALRQLTFPHIKANELYESQMGLIKEYYDDKCNNFALVMGENGDWNKAEELVVQMMNMRKKLLGAEHPSTLKSMQHLAGTYWYQGRWNEAEQLEIKALDMRKIVLGAEHPDTLTSMGNLANTYHKQRKWNEAEQLGVQVLNRRIKLFGVEHPDTLTSMTDLAATYHGQDKWIEADQLVVQALDTRKRMFGAEHPDTLKSMTYLAGTYYKQGKWNEAEQLILQVLNKRKLFGAEHPDTLGSMTNLAAIYHEQGKWNEAEQLDIGVLNIRKKLLGSEHPSTLTSMGHLAKTYHRQGKWNEAEQLVVQVLDKRMKLFGVEHPDTLESMTDLAATYQKQEKWNEAEQLVVKALDKRKKMFGAEHPDTLESMTNLESIYHEWGKFNKAEQLNIQVLDIRKKLLGVEQPDTLTSMENIAMAYSKQSQMSNWSNGNEEETTWCGTSKHPQILANLANIQYSEKLE